MPFKSKAQQRFMFANKKKLEKEGVDVKEWADATDYKHLPERAGKQAEFLEGLGRLGARNVGN